MSTAQNASGPPGVGLSVQGDSVDPASCPTVFVFLDGDRLGQTSVHDDGRYAVSHLSVPADASAGPHQLTTSCSSSGHPVLQQGTFTVTKASVHRSSLATSLHPIGSVSHKVKDIAVSAIATVGLIVLIAFPSELFNTTLEEHYDEIKGWFGFAARAGERVKGAMHAGTVAIFFVVSAVLYGLLDPSFTLSVGSLVVFVGIVTSLVMVTAGFSVPVMWYMRRKYGERGFMEVLPGTLVIAAVCVLLSRVLHFQPGYLYGLIAGIAFERELSRAEEGRMTALSALCVLAGSVVAWLAWIPVSHRAAQPHPSLLLLMAETALAAAFIGGIESTVFSLLPIRFMEGSKLVAWSRAAWVALFGAAVFVFVHVLLRPGTGYVVAGGGVSVWTVLALFCGFGVLSVAFWGYFRFRPARDTEARTRERVV